MTATGTSNLATTTTPPALAIGGSITVSYNYAAGCAGAGTTSSSGTLTTTSTPVAPMFKVGTTTVVGSATADLSMTSLAYSFTVNGSPVVAATTPIAVTCQYSSSTYTPQAQTVLFSSASGPMTFQVTSKPSWVTLTANSAPVVLSTTTLTAPVSITFTPNACSGAVGSSMSGSITLTDNLSTYPTQTKTMAISLQIVSPTPLTIVAPAAKTYAKGSGTTYYPTWPISVKSLPSGLFFTIDPTTLPNWLTVSAMSGTATTSGLALTFQATGAIDTLPVGSYGPAVTFKVSGYTSTTVTINLTVQNPAPTLSFVEGTVRNLTWIQGQPLPTATITAVSSDSPISYSISTSGAISLPSKPSGLAYNSGTLIPVVFNALAFAQVQPGAVLVGTETLQWGSNSTVITFNITVQGAATTATLSGTSPLNLPTAVAGQTFTVNLYGTGLVPSSDPTQKTTFGLVSGGVIVTDSNVVGTVVNSSTIALTLTVPNPPATGDPLLPWTGGATVTFGVCNPAGGTCSVPTGTTTLIIGAGPTISSITSASTFKTIGTTTPTPAPYDILTIWGSNFCAANGSGCSATQVLYGTPDPVTLTYPTYLSPDAGQRQLTVTFTQTTTCPAPTGCPGHLLFATNGQINVLVPGTLSAAAATVTVGFGGLSSSAASITIGTSNPGIFTVNANGVGQGAILNNSTWALISGSNPAGMSAASDTVDIYATGLGKPLSTGPTGTPNSTNITDCASIAHYEGYAGGLSSLDGVVIQSSLLPSGVLPPCLAVAPDVFLGSTTKLSAGVGYAGWVADAVAGLYQVNVTLPSPTGPFTDAAGHTPAAITAPVQLPIEVGLVGATGATIWVEPRLSFTLSGCAVSAATGGTITCTVTAAGGTGTHTFDVGGTVATGSATAIASGNLAGLTISSATNVLTISTAPTASGVYVITVNAADASTPYPITGSTTFKLTVTGETVAPTALPAAATTYGTPNSAVTTIGASGGIAPYAYALVTPPTGFGFDPASGAISVSTSTVAKAGIYHLHATATDSTASPLVGDIFFDVPVALGLTSSLGSTVTGTRLAANSNLTTIIPAGMNAANAAALTWAVSAVAASTSTCTFTITGGVLATSGACTADTYYVTVSATDTVAPTGGDVATSSLSFVVTLS